MEDWLNHNIEHALDHFGRTTEPKKVLCDQAWYKEYSWRGVGDSRSIHYLVNDLLGQRIPITEQMYDNKALTMPTNKRINNTE